MKKSQVLAVLALIMALGLATPAILSASAEEGQSADDQSGETSSIERITPDGTVTPTELESTEGTTPSDNTPLPTSVSTLDELTTALANPDISAITITATITLTEDMTLNIEGKTLTLASDVTRMFNIQKGNVTISGNGTLSSNGSTSQTGDAILWVTGSDADSGFENYTTLTVESGVKIVTTNSYGLAVHYLTDKQLARGVTVNLAGAIEAPYGISVNGNIQETENAPVLNITGSVTSTANDLAIFAAGYAKWNLNGATLTGATPLGIKSGKFVLDGATLKATGAYNPDLAASGSGMAPNGSTFQIENSQPYVGAIDIEIKSGSYESVKGPVFTEYGSTTARTAGSHLERLAISGGTFNSAADQPVFVGVATAETVISGGSFNNDEGLEEYLKTDQKLVQDADGNFIVQTNTPANPDKPDDKPTDDPEDDKKPTTKPEGDKKPSSSSPNTGILATIEHAANAVGAVGTTVITGVLVASGAALAWFLGTRRGQNSGKSASKSSKSAKNAKNGRNFHLDRIEVEISTTPKAAAKSSKSASKSVSSARKAVSAKSTSGKSSVKVSAATSKTSKKLSASSAKTSAKASKSAKSASSRKTAVSSRSAAKSAKKRA